MKDIDFLLATLNANAVAEDDGFYRCCWLMFHKLYCQEHKEKPIMKQLSLDDFLEEVNYGTSL